MWKTLRRPLIQHDGDEEAEGEKDENETPSTKPKPKRAKKGAAPEKTQKEKGDSRKAPPSMSSPNDCQEQRRGGFVAGLRALREEEAGGLI